MAKKTRKGPSTITGLIRRHRRQLKSAEHIINGHTATLQALNEARAVDRMALETLRTQLQQMDVIEVTANNYTNAVLRQPSDQREINAMQEALIQAVLSHRKNNGLPARTVRPARTLIAFHHVTGEKTRVAGSDMVDNEEALRALD